MATADLPSDLTADVSGRRSPARTAPRRLALDRFARLFVTIGGLGIIASILGILFFIVVEIVPLLRGAHVEATAPVAATGRPEALRVDEYGTLAVGLDRDGTLRISRLADGSEVERASLLDLLPAPPEGEAPPPAPSTLAVAAAPRAPVFAASTSDGRVVVQPIGFRVTFDDEADRTVHADRLDPSVLVLDPEARPLGRFAIQGGEDLAAAGAQLADGSLTVVRRRISRNDFTGEIDEELDRVTLPAAPTLSALLLDQDAANLFGGTADGQIYWWRLSEGDGATPDRLSAGRSGVTAMTQLIGNRALVVGQADGAISIWFPVRDAQERFRLTRIRDFESLGSPVALLSPSNRNRTFLAVSEDGRMALDFSTSERRLWSGRSPLAQPTAATLMPRGNGALLAGPSTLQPFEIRNEHPETSWRALFGKVWYEGYEKPELAWQSTGMTDAFESKLSLTPLLVGTLKGTFYSLLLAIPLGILGAMFASQFLHPTLLGYLKPTVEIMAALPSVVLGFLAGLWLAPILERTFPALLLMLLAVPVSVWLAGLAWNRVPLKIRNRFPAGFEVIPYAVVIVAVMATCLALSRPFEVLLFDGSFQQWLYSTTGLAYDQRNAVVVGIGMGFAVIPIIFAIAEDAFSNVPKNLIAGSLALGASRWQTVTKVVLPTASPGIFSAVMIGFGRAIGETMIVLMATGNTPILDLSAFNGFRTLSANIAVEIPEAPQGGTLYRTLFLAALLLFGLTFLVNTVAELVRQRLRRKFAQL